MLGMGFVTAALCSLMLGQQSPAPQKIWQGFGVNIRFTEPAQGEIELLQSAGMDYVRTDFSWEATEKTAGQYDFSAYDRLFGRLKAAHIRPLFVLDYGNDLYQHGAPRTDKAQEAYANWAAAAITHFKGEEIVWEIWNEPNVNQFFKPVVDPGAYTSLAVKAAKAMRQADPGCRIIAPGVSTIDVEFLRKVLTPELLSLIDGVSIHPYRSSGPETVVKDYQRVQNLILSIAPRGREHLPVICSEWGYSTYKGGQVNEDRQAMYLAKSWLLSAMAGCPISIFYDWKDDGPSATNREHRYGIVRSNLSPKPAYDAARLVLKAFHGCTVFERMQKKDPLEWVIVGAGDGKLIRARWHQKLGGLPKFEAYDMADRSNRALYNRIIDQSQVDTTVAVKPPVTTGTKPPTDPPKTNSGTGKVPVVTAFDLAFAPPLDDEGWCAVISRPATTPKGRIEFRYERKESGAKVSCFASTNTERTVEPLADMDAETVIQAFMGTQKIGDFSMKKIDLVASDLVLKTWKDGNSTSSDVLGTQLGASAAYDLSSGAVGCGLEPKQRLDVPDGAQKLVIWIRSDSTNNRLSARLVDENGQVFRVDLGTLDGYDDRNGWRAVVIPVTNLPASTSGSGQSTPVGKLHWDSLLYVEPGDKATSNGKIEFGPAAYEF